MKTHRFAPVESAVALLLAVWIGSVVPSLAQTESYTWSTIAGMPGVGGTNDGINSDARLNRPSGLAVDGKGNLYVSEQTGPTERLAIPYGRLLQPGGIGW